MCVTVTSSSCSPGPARITDAVHRRDPPGSSHILLHPPPAPERMLLLLMHLLLLSGVVSMCPADDNPLILDPPEIVIKYGKELVVNCTTKNYDFNEMYWSDGMSQDVTKDTVISLRVSASDWNVKASCAIKLNDSLECRTDLKITVYKAPDMVDLRRPLNTLVEGRQQQLLCDVINVAPVQNLTVRWYKDDTIIMTESFNRTTKTPANESSALSVNVSRGEVLFRCEAQLDFDSDTLVTSDQLTVSGHYAPELNNISDQVLHVAEGVDVTLMCEIDAKPPPQYHWTRDGEKLSNNTDSLTVANILASANYSCTATNYLGSRTRRIRVYVSNVVTTAAASAPVDGTDCSPTLTPSELVVRFGDPASIDCNISVPGFLAMGWEAPIGGTGLLTSPSATWTVDQLEAWDPNPFCFVNLLNERQCVSAPSITVYKAPDRVDLRRPLNTLVEGRQQQLLCDVINVAPVQNLTVRWYKDDTIIMTESFNRTTKTPANESSALSVNVSRGEVLFRCEAQLDFDSDTLVTSDRLIVSGHYAPELNNISDQVLHVAEGVDVTLTCEIDAKPPPQYHWTRDGEKLLNNTDSLTVANILASANYSCTATNYLGSRTRRIRVYVSNVATTAAASAPVDGTDCCPTLTPSELVVRFGDPASIDCNISVPGFLAMGWEAPIGGTGLLTSPSATWTVDKLEVWDPNPFCFVNLLNERLCVSAPSITVYKPPDRVSLLSPKPMVEGTEHLLRCHIVNVAPIQNLTVRWYRGSEPVHTEMFHSKHANAPKTPQNHSFILRVSPERGHNGARYKCEAELHLGPEIPEPVSTTSQPYIAVVHFAPTFTRGNHSEEISLGGDVTFGCHAEGNPDPEVHWFYASADNVRETTRGRQTNITIQQATSTNAGHYVCVATNEVGTVTRLVTVTIKDEGGEGLLGFSWWYLPLIIISVVIVFFVATVFHCHKKHGRYSFISVRTNEEIPLGTKSAAGGIY